MTPLERALRDRIRSEGAISVEVYMEACNTYYYATRDPLGGTGDFTTAPEISQMFGELAGAVLADCWIRAGRPDGCFYAELGPGRGTLAADALRALRAAGWAGTPHLVETSPALRARQAEAVPDARWHDDLSTLPDAPILCVANEFFDALPVRQHAGGHERRVQILANGLAFDRDGEIVETSPARSDLAEALGRRLADHGGAALIVDYGYARSGPGDTLQAVRAHRFAPVLASPGEQDLTAHVDFQALGEALRKGGARTGSLVEQGAWLHRIGIAARASALSRAHPDRADSIAAAVHRLTADEAMGSLFKCLAAHGPQWPRPAGF